MARFTLPRDIYYGKGAIAELRNLEGGKAVIVTGGNSMRRFGWLDLAKQHLESAGFSVEIIEDVESDPSVETVMRGAELMRAFEPDWIVAIGGGSPIDAAKAMWVFYEYPVKTFDEIVKPFSLPKLRTKARFAAIPSTSGTATEVTAFSVITDYEKGIKYPLADYNLTPDVAIVDPELAMSMPKSLVAYTGMDALTHAVEAYVSTLHSPFTDPLALKAISMVFEYLPSSHDGDESAREQMHYAQCLAGMAFTNALLGITHSIAHKTGAVFETGHIPHGCANAICMPYVIAYNMKDAAACERYAEIARALGVTARSDEDAAQMLITKINSLNRRFNIPSSYREFGVDEKEFNEKLITIAQNAVADACTGSNPRGITDRQMEKLLWAIYAGEEVNV